MTENIHVIPNVIFIPPRQLVRLGNRWIIYLPVDMNEVWESIKHRGLKVKAYLIVENIDNRLG
jgi:hypothetical protein